MKAAGLNRRFYASEVRQFVDYDYDSRLPESARVWLAAFTEEHYRGWRLKSEEQLLGLEELRAADAARKRAARGRGSEPLLMCSLEDFSSDSASRAEIRGGHGALWSSAPTESELVAAIDRARARARRNKR